MSDETMEHAGGERPGAWDHTAQTPASCHLLRRLRLHAQKLHFLLTPQPRSLLSRPSWLLTDLHSETNLHPGQQSPHLKALFFCPFSPSPLRSLGTEEGRVPGGADLGVGQSNAPFLPQATSTTVSLGGHNSKKASHPTPIPVPGTAFSFCIEPHKSCCSRVLKGKYM